MAEISRLALFGKLNPIAYKALESATVFCKLRGNPYVEVAHWVHQVLQLADSDLHRIVRHFGMDPSRLAADLTAALDGLPRGSTAVSDLSGHLEEMVERAWVYGSLLFGDAQIRTGYLVVGALKTAGLKHILLNLSGQFAKVSLETLTDRFDDVVAGSPEQGQAARDGSAPARGADGEPAPAVMGRQEALGRFCQDLTARAREGSMDPVLGRDVEIRQIVDILLRRRQNNPILTGEAGVGKTAVVEGLAQRIAAEDVPPPLRGVRLLMLDLGLLQAGASVKGEFESRLRQVIDEVKASPEPIILFIDEAHTLIGAGGPAGQGDAANLLKPALARGELRTIAATTWAEYKKYFEKDAALTRRFQVVKVDEPSEELALRMIRGLASRLEGHHRVAILDEALSAAVRLSHRYIPSRQLPDKAVSLLDTACSRVAMSQHAVPAEVEDARRRIEALEVEQGILAHEQAVGLVHGPRMAEIEAALQVQRDRLAALQERWDREQALVSEILTVRARLREDGQVEALDAATIQAEAPPAVAGNGQEAQGASTALAEPLGGDGAGDDLERLQALQAELSAAQGESPLVLPCVDEQAVAAVVADWTGIPVGRMVKNEIQAVLTLGDTLERRILGQRHALEVIARRIQTSRAGLDNPARPIGVFLLAGPSGVGKTETALALAEALYGGEQNLITINMSEFQEAHTVSTLKGAPPGYVGYGEGGVLTEAVRRRPYSVVLLDEVEKAHRDVHEIFFQVFDKGWMEDGEGRLIDFKNTVILLTTNVGSEVLMSLFEDPALAPDAEGAAKALRGPMLGTFPAAFLGRLTVVPYFPIGTDVLRQIIQLQLGRVARRLEQGQQIALRYDEALVEQIAGRCSDVESGARVVDSIITHTLLPQISQEFLTRLMQGEPIAEVRIGVQDGGFTFAFH